MHADGVEELRDAFDLTTKARAMGPEARDVADRWFFETVVRVHRAGEGAALTGSNLPASMSARSSRRLDRALRLKTRAGDSVADARAHVEAMLGLQVWAHGVHKQMTADPHAHAGGHEHPG